VLAAIDCRVDAIVPTIAWHSLATSLDKNDSAKQGWGDILYLAAHNRKLDPHITSSHTKSDTTGLLGAENVAWLAARGPGDLVQQITAPTLFLQGTVDTLFTLDEAVSNYTILKDKGVPTAMVWYCGGHGTCLTKAGDPVRTNAATIAWLARYLKGDTGVQNGAGFTTVDQNGNELSADAYPPAPGAAITASGSGSLHLVATKVQTPKPVPGASSGLIGAVALGITPARATNGLDVTVPIASAALVLGAPSLTITYSGTTPPGPKPTRVFAQLVDPTTNLVVGNQITPIPVTLDGHRHTATVPLEMVAFSAPAGGHLTLQVVASTAAYSRPRFGGTVHFATISISLPTVSGMRTAAATR
jgi:ABC-2 type transport system ATP-binding protein